MTFENVKELISNANAHKELTSNANVHTPAAGLESKPNEKTVTLKEDENKYLNP